MRREELVAQLEAAKALTSVVSIDNVIALIQQLEEGQAVKPEYSITAKLFTRVVDIIEDTIDGMHGRDVVDLGTAEFELDWNNCINLTDISLDTDYIYNEIREQLEFAFDIVDEEEEEVIEAQEQSASEE